MTFYCWASAGEELAELARIETHRAVPHGLLRRCWSPRRQPLELDVTQLPLARMHDAMRKRRKGRPGSAVQSGRTEPGVGSGIIRAPPRGRMGGASAADGGSVGAASRRGAFHKRPRAHRTGRTRRACDSKTALQGCYTAGPGRCGHAFSYKHKGPPRA